MINRVPALRRQSKETEGGGVGPVLYDDNLGGEILEEVDGGALMEVLGWMFEHSEDDGLRARTNQSEYPGSNHHQSRKSKKFNLSKYILMLKAILLRHMHLHHNNHAPLQI